MAASIALPLVAGCGNSAPSPSTYELERAYLINHGQTPALTGIGKGRFTLGRPVDISTSIHEISGICNEKPTDSTNGAHLSQKVGMTIFSGNQRLLDFTVNCGAEAGQFYVVDAPLATTVVVRAAPQQEWALLTGPSLQSQG